ncbi:MAG: sugar ABC transporter substrate-binding protein [Clostridiales bacterium]|jgi:putative multiple sugar transport system substrate-binding protein|nr:sugar ABC transporter substrate-binding protein [Clostridiales bacterium]OPZ68919.1 MAG: Multiple sugar-binding periplasmic receptor ChvE precursor [Firmicutes bacterium ADurb.Bin467]
MKKLITLFLALLLVFSASALAEGKIGVAMPTQDLQRWNQDGANMKAQLEAAGYEVILTYSSNDVARQVSDLENMILNEVDVLVVASIDGSALDTVLSQAKEEGIPIIAYDRLLTKTEAVDYYATFDNYMVGTIQGTYIKERFDLDNVTEPLTIELFAGSPDDNNAYYFFNGAWDVLKPYIDAGKLVVKSGQTDFETIAILGWGSDDAQARMDNLLTAYYSDGVAPDIVLSPNDSLALGIVNSLKAAGFSLEEFPVITGQDCDVANTKNIIAGYQAMSVFKDTRTLASKVVEMVDAIMKGAEVPVNDTTTYDNGVKVVPSFLCEPVFADVNNYEELLIESGYYTPDQLAG